MVKRFMAPGPWITRDLKECVLASDYDALAAERDALLQNSKEWAVKYEESRAEYHALAQTEAAMRRRLEEVVGDCERLRGIIDQMRGAALNADWDDFDSLITSANRLSDSASVNHWQCMKCGWMNTDPYCPCTAEPDVTCATHGCTYRDGKCIRCWGRDAHSKAIDSLLDDCATVYGGPIQPLDYFEEGIADALGYYNKKRVDMPGFNDSERCAMSGIKYEKLTGKDLIAALRGGAAGDLLEDAGYAAADEIERLQRVLQKVMARCADLLDEDQFNELDAIARAAVSASEDIVREQRLAETEALLREARETGDPCVLHEDTQRRIDAFLARKP